MKWILCILVLTGLVLCAGCTTVSTTPPAPATVPNMLGTWTGPAKGYIKGTGFADSGLANGTMTVTEQKDRFFSGTISFPLKNGTVHTEGFGGVITPDGKTFRIIEYDTRQHDDGWILSQNELEMIFMDDSDTPMIMVDSFKRSP